MEGKAVILSVFVMSLVMTQIQVEAYMQSCCSSMATRTAFELCHLGAHSYFCASLSGCKLIVYGTPCPSGYTNDIPVNSGDVINEYCKIGCISSTCNAFTTLQDASGIVNRAVYQCTKACSTFCTKNSMIRVERA